MNSFCLPSLKSIRHHNSNTRFGERRSPSCVSSKETMKINKKDLLGRHVRRKVNKRYIFGKISERVGENWLVVYPDGNEEEMTFSDISKYFWAGLLPIVHPSPHEQEQKVQEMEVPSPRMTFGESKTVLQKRKHDNSVNEEEEWSLPKIDSANNFKKQPPGKRSKKSGNQKKVSDGPEKVCSVQEVSCPSTVVGQFIRKRFFENFYFGLITRFDGDYFNVVYEDGDYEDIEEAEAVDLIWKSPIPENQRKRCFYFAEEYEMLSDPPGKDSSQPTTEGFTDEDEIVFRK